jgi:multiple sugar transport system substrate-binding protein
MKTMKTVLLVLLVCALCLPLVSAQDSIPLTDPATGARPYEGAELRIVNTEVVPILAYEHEILDPAYEEASGVTLIYENVAHSDLLPRIQTMCAAGGDDFDIMFVEDGWAGALSAMGCLQELDSLYLAAPGDSHPDDFTTRAFGTVAMNKEKWVGIPTLVAVGMFAYRTDLFGDPDEQAAFQEAYGRELTVPQTWEELAEVGEFFTRPEDELWGFNYRYGTPNNILFDYMIHFGFSRGVDFFDADFNPLFGTDAAIETAEFFAGQDFLNLQPPGRESYQFGEVLQNFTQGKVAMYGTESWAIPLLLDPEASIVAEHTAFAPIPGWRNPDTGEIQSSLLSAGPAYMINANISDERKAVAWDYLQLAHGKQFARLLADQRGAGHRTSALTDPDLVAKWPHLTANYEAAKVGIGRPAEPWWPEAENAIGRALQEIAAGGDAASLMAEANADIVEIVADAGYYDDGITYVSVEQREDFVCAKMAELGLSHMECM